MKRSNRQHSIVNTVSLTAITSQRTTSSHGIRSESHREEIEAARRDLTKHPHHPTDATIYIAARLIRTTLRLPIATPFVRRPAILPSHPNSV